MFYLAVCNSTQGNGVFLGDSQQHSRKVAYFLGGEWNRQRYTFPWRLDFGTQENHGPPKNFHFGVVID